jgi:hypothetical protein
MAARSASTAVATAVAAPEVSAACSGETRVDAIKTAPITARAARRVKFDLVFDIPSPHFFPLMNDK